MPGIGIDAYHQVATPDKADALAKIESAANVEWNKSRDDNSKFKTAVKHAALSAEALLTHKQIMGVATSITRILPTARSAWRS